MEELGALPVDKVTHSCCDADGRVCRILVFPLHWYRRCGLPSTVLIVSAEEGRVHWQSAVKGKKVKAVCGSYSTAALRHIVLLPE